MNGPPDWVAPMDRLLAHAAREVRLLGAATPIDAAKERARLAEAFARGDAVSPRWRYPPFEATALLRALEQAMRSLNALDGDPLARIYRERCAELAIEAEACEAVGTTRFAKLAAARFGASAGEPSDEARDVAARWLEEDPPPPEPEASLVPTDADDPRALASRMRAEIGRRRIPFSVELYAELAPLAATGERTIFVASGRTASDEDVARTVLHEIEAHAMPRARAKLQRLGVFASGTARGADDQEGRALVLEQRAGFLGARRRRQLAARHAIALRMLEGATFADAVRWSISTCGVAAPEAVLLAERAYRGGDGERPGLGRDRVYLEAFVRVRAHLAERPADEAVLAQGQVALGAIDVLRAWAFTG